jgi:hypothetical protein
MVNIAYYTYYAWHYQYWGRRDRDRMVVGFTITCANNAFHHYSCEFEPRSCDKVCQ